MDGSSPLETALLGTDTLGRLMPMYLWLAPGGTIRALGPTLAKLFDRPVAGDDFLAHFAVEKPSAINDMAGMRALWGQKLFLSLRGRDHLVLRGLALPVADGQGTFLNLSFGIAVAEAVRDHRLSNADFAPTDLTVELLYLTEVKAAVMGELGALNARLQAARAASEAQALSDALTGLANRRALDGDLEKTCHLAARGEGAFALLHLDLDFFKAVNDTFGHAAGDAVLVEVARILRQETRKSDTVARVGGDEFVLILRGDLDAPTIIKMARRLISQLEVPIPFEGKLCKISGSIGVTLSGYYAAPEPDQMQSDADEATYASKHAGRGRCTLFLPQTQPGQA